jgi:glyoxylase-like metal-dependent hydrolase (beta-lactamase superfamily II)
MKLLLFLIALATIVSPAQSQTPVSPTPRYELLDHFEVVKVADGVYSFISPEAKIPLVSGNSTAIIGDDGVLVVDSGHFPSLTRRVIAEIRKLTNKPVRYLVNTHWHADHITGNYLYKEAFSDVAIISTAYTQEKIVHFSPEFDDTKQLTEFRPVLVRLTTEKKRRDGTPIPSEDLDFFQRMLQATDSVLPEFRDIKRIAPDLAFTDKIHVDIGHRAVEVMFLGRGNTGGDAVIYVPQSKVLITGDLLVYPIPYAFGAFMSEWIETLNHLAKIDATAIVPGHGPVQRNHAYLDRVRAMLEAVSRQAREGAQQGLTLEQVRAKVNLDAFKQEFAGGDPYRRRSFDENFAYSAVERAYREAKEGKLKDFK